MNTRLLFGGIIALVLLALYAYALVEAIRLALSPHPADLGSGLSYTLSTIGGLVSALVITELAITRPGDPPGVRSLIAPANQPPPAPSTTRTVGIIGLIYVLVWIALGVAAYVVGAMQHPEKVKALTDFGQAWVGLAVAAAYAYFGINR
jgi:hypothetical protein